MSNLDENWEKAGIKARQIAVGIVWNQWASLGSMARSTSKTSSNRVIDPEALVLSTLALQAEERRLTEMLQWWAKDGTALLSIQRMRKLAKQTGSRGMDFFSEYAGLASINGHRSWTKYANQNDDLRSQHSEPNRAVIQLNSSATLFLRLRSAFGVGVKADVLSLLISTSETSTTVPEISKYLAFTPKSIRSALKDMAVAGLIRESDGRPVNYSTDQRAWHQLLYSEDEWKIDKPEWTMWAALFPFLISAIEICTSAVSSNLNGYLVNSYARDLVETYQFAFEYHHINIPDPTDFPGNQYSKAFAEIINSLSRWAEV